MANEVALLDAAPEFEACNGLIYIIIGGVRRYACTPHCAKLASRRMVQAIAEFDGTAAKVVGIR